MSDSIFCLVEAFVPKEILLHFDFVEVKKEYNVYRIYKRMLHEKPVQDITYIIDY